MTPITEVNVDFTLHGVADLNEAGQKAMARFTDLGITEEAYQFSFNVRLYPGLESRADDGTTAMISWDADITMKGRKR